MVTDEQVRLLRRKRMDGKSQEAAAAAAGMSVRTARGWEQGPLPSQTKKKRGWRTRKDPFERVWESDIEPLLLRDHDRVLEGPTILELLEQRHPGEFGVGQLRTLQRRIRDWRALHGSDCEVFFEQVHPPGREAQIDFTHATELGVTIAGAVFPHLLFEFVLSFSGWRWVCLASGETYEALMDGIQGALWSLGGAPEVIRSDNLSAATHELKRSGGRALTERFAVFLGYYGLRSTRIHPGRSHENGVAEQAHRRLKSALRQALVIRGSRDFGSVADYEAFVQKAVDRLNRRSKSKIDEERAHLQALPIRRLPAYTSYKLKVHKWSTIRLSNKTYSVPSRLRGHEVEARQFANQVEIYYRGQFVERMPRLRGGDNHRIDYRHIIWSLVRKPGAFARYRFREELFPTTTFRCAYDALVRFKGERADIEYVRTLHLAASTMESLVEEALRTLLDRRVAFDYVSVRDLAAPVKPAVPTLATPEVPDLTAYDALLVGGIR
ncbi:MAG: IS21 family transposase [Deltaproteobacteria bacterium]|nr:IS21 family transposase [Deltaproteobacteria bacterium]